MNTDNNDQPPTPLQWLPKNREEAEAIDSDRYTSDRSCALGHVGPRWTVDGSCSLCRPEAPTSQDTTSEIEEEEEQEEGVPVSVNSQPLRDFKEDFEALKAGLIEAYGLGEESRRYFRALRAAKKRRQETMN